MTENARATIGDNRPPEDDLRASLAIKYDGDEILVASLEKQARALPDKVDSDEELAAFTNLVQRINKEAKNLEAFRVKEKEPFLQGGRAVDGWFTSLGGRLNTHKQRLERVAGDYLRRKEAAARAAREEEAARLRAVAMEAVRAQAEAEAAARPVEAAVHRSTIDSHLSASKAAATSAANAKPADFARTRTSEGNLATLVESWTFEIVDRDALQKTLGPLGAYFSEAAIETAIRAFVRIGRRELDGVRIFSTTSAAIR